MGVMRYETLSEVFDPSRQTVFEKRVTGDPGKARQIIASLRPGYEKDGKIVRREMVEVYVYQAQAGQESKAGRSGDDGGQ